jgi:hypothetical protein
MTAAALSRRDGAGGRWFSHRLFGLCGEGGVCPPAPAPTPAAEPATPGWRGALPLGMKPA